MPFTTTYKIRFDDVDGAGLVYYPHYFHLCHQALEDFFDDQAPFSYAELIRDRRLGVPTVAIESTYRSPLRYGDRAVISMRVERLGNSSLVFGYTVHREPGGQECFTARITTVLTDLDKETPVPLAGSLRELFKTLLPG